MQVSLEPSKYIVAVSGGVDSVTLLDMLSKQPELDLVIAHFDHGIRNDAARDCKFVGQLAKSYDLPFEFAEGRLGKSANEATAREARYKFLRQVKDKYRATAIITAHHQDDLIETMILNLMRGTGRKGITSLGEKDDIRRPLLSFTKQELIDYAQKNNLKWREDATNTDTKYLRNWIRLNVVPKLSKQERQQLLAIHQQFEKRNQEIDMLVSEIIGDSKRYLPRQIITQADHSIAKELIASWLRANGIRNFDEKNIERIVVGAKTLKPTKTIPVAGNITITVQAKHLQLKP